DGEDKMLKINQMAVFREEFDNNSLLFDPITGKAFYLNPVATFIWQQLCLERSFGEIEKGILSRFSNTPLDLKSDLDDFLRSLIDNGFMGNEV
ncbi:MAG TPA: PqqD family peptide modification chaperone, partial [Methanosarcina sp.]|nr:PqqD family peptide modification chaperone [Methanosarcina sp.]